MLQILIFHGDPCFEEPLVEKCRPCQHPLALDFRINGQQDLQIVGIGEIGMHGVGTFDDRQLFGDDPDRFSQREGCAVKGPVKKLSTGPQRNQNLFPKTFVVDISTDFSETFLGALLGTEEKVVHMQQIAVVAFCQSGSQCGFAGGAVSVNGDDDGTLTGQKSVDPFPNQGEFVIHMHWLSVSFMMVWHRQRAWPPETLMT